jgi:hypothetical protein
VFTTPKLHAGSVFAVSGKVDQHTNMPSSAARKLGIGVDDGAVFRLTRAVAEKLPLCVSVFTPNVEITKRLMSAYDDTERLAMLVRVVYEPPDRPWPRILLHRGRTPKSKKFAFIVDELVQEVE